MGAGLASGGCREECRKGWQSASGDLGDAVVLQDYADAPGKTSSSSGSPQGRQQSVAVAFNDDPEQFRSLPIFPGAAAGQRGPTLKDDENLLRSVPSNGSTPASPLTAHSLSSLGARYGRDKYTAQWVNSGGTLGELPGNLEAELLDTAAPLPVVLLSDRGGESKKSGASLAASSGGSSVTTNGGNFRSNRHRGKAIRLMVTHTMGMLPSNALQLIIEHSGSVLKHYSFEAVLGQGAFGKVRKGRMKVTGAERAIKQINKEKLKTSIHLLRKEVEIMKVIDHPNLLMLFEIFEDETHMYMVLEICGGGTLQQYLRKTKYLSEGLSAIAMKQILRAVYYLQLHSVVHRDLKADNILLSMREKLHHPDNMLKVSDFGLSCFIAPQEVLTQVCGTPTHMAPEVSAKRYGAPCDLWGCGVILYELLSGTLPFTGETKAEVHQRVAAAKVRYDSDRWLKVSQDSLDLVSGLLKKDASARLSALEALQGHCIQRLVPSAEAVELPVQILQDLQRFRSHNKLKRAFLHVFASFISDEHVAKARRAFFMLDTNGDGSFQISELQDRLQAAQQKGDKRASKINQADIFRDGPDEDGTKDFTYTEFLAATFPRKAVLRSEGVWEAAFSTFDKNGDGKVSISELATGKLLGKLPIEELLESLDAVDQDGDGELDFAEFRKMMRTGSMLESTPSADEKAELPRARSDHKVELPKGDQPEGRAARRARTEPAKEKATAKARASAAS